MSELRDSRIREIHRIIEELLNEPAPPFIPGVTPITTGRAVYDHAEVNAVIDSLLAGWLGMAGRSREMEDLVARYHGLARGVLVNSGSSANLVALAAVREGLPSGSGEIIVPASAYPTTVNPIIQLGFTPVFVDVDETLNITPSVIEAARSPLTRGIVFAHAMGNPAPIEGIMAVARRHGLFVIEDCCAAMGARFAGRMVGTWGTASTLSFYAAHGITMGEGGAMLTDDPHLADAAAGYRDWGRDCRCGPDDLNASGVCGRRFKWHIDGIPYDHRYCYSRIGYNLKPLELQAAMGIEQLKRLNGFIAARRTNERRYRERLAGLAEYISIPPAHPMAEPVPFGLTLILRNSRLDRMSLVRHLETKRINTRLFFAGNILKQPAYKGIDYRVVGELSVTEELARNALWIGVHPGITMAMIDYVGSILEEYCHQAGLHSQK